MDLSIIIINWNTRQLLLDCLASIKATVRELTYEIWVVDNCSSDDSVSAVQNSYPEVRLIANRENLGFAKANNQALSRMAGRYALLLNSDTVLTEQAVARLWRFMEDNQRVGIACGQLLNQDGSLQNSFANFPSVSALFCNETLLRLLFPKRFPSKLQKYDTPLVVESCIGACMMIRKEAMEEVGLLDERYFFYMEETDWAKTMGEAGWQSCFIPDAKIYHLQGKSVGYSAKARIMFHRSRLNYFKKWHPGHAALLTIIAFCRVAINTLLNFIAVLCTLGCLAGVRNRFLINAQLAFWYLKGCP